MYENHLTRVNRPAIGNSSSVSWAASRSMCERCCMLHMLCFTPMHANTDLRGMHACCCRGHSGAPSCRGGWSAPTLSIPRAPAPPPPTPHLRTRILQTTCMHHCAAASAPASWRSGRGTAPIRYKSSRALSGKHCCHRRNGFHVARLMTCAFHARSLTQQC